MNKKILRIPEGIFFLGDYPQLINEFPNKPFILNKVMTGCGATTMFLRDNVPTILCSPRKEMLRSKATNKEFSGKVHLFGSGAGPYDTVLKKINDMKDYVRSTIPLPMSQASVIPKILVTYDSTGYVLQGLQEMGYLGNFRLVVDEFHTLFTDAAFRGDIEIQFFDNVLNINIPTVFLSATPYIEEYLDQVPGFKDLPYLELEWPESSKHPASIITAMYYRGSRTETIKKIIDKYNSCGYFEELMDSQGNIHRATEAVFFINDPKFIKTAVLRNNIPTSDVNVICADCEKNKKILAKAGLKIGHAPAEGAPHPTFTFVTKCSYEGTDFYSTNAYTYIFSDIRQDSSNLAIDISLDLSQILGRQRLESNVFRYNATMFCKTIPNFDDQSEIQYMNRIQRKSDLTILGIQQYEGVQNKDVKEVLTRKYKYAQKYENYENDYISVVDDVITNQAKCTFNHFVKLNEIRSWYVQKYQYQDRIYVMSHINNSLSQFTSESSRKVNEFMLGFNGAFPERMKKYADFLDANPDCIDEIQSCVQIPSEIKQGYSLLGSKKLEEMSWQRNQILIGISGLVNNIAAIIQNTFLIGSWYSTKEAKQKLQAIYDQYSPGKVAKASDLINYFECDSKKKTSDTGIRKNGYLIKSIKTN